MGRRRPRRCLSRASARRSARAAARASAPNIGTAAPPPTRSSAVAAPAFRTARCGAAPTRARARARTPTRRHRTQATSPPRFRPTPRHGALSAACWYSVDLHLGEMKDVVALIEEPHVTRLYRGEGHRPVVKDALAARHGNVVGSVRADLDTQWNGPGLATIAAVVDAHLVDARQLAEIDASPLAPALVRMNG